MSSPATPDSDPHAAIRIELWSDLPTVSSTQPCWPQQYQRMTTLLVQSALKDATNPRHRIREASVTCLVGRPYSAAGTANVPICQFALNWRIEQQPFR